MYKNNNISANFQKDYFLSLVIHSHINNDSVFTSTSAVSIPHIEVILIFYNNRKYQHYVLQIPFTNSRECRAHHDGIQSRKGPKCRRKRPIYAIN